METLFSWIHLSDLHFGHGDIGYQGEQKLVLHELAKDIPTQVAMTGKSLSLSNWRPDALIVSGDVAFSADARSADEYSTARRWLFAVADGVGIPRGHILMVPGNHDIKRLVKPEDPDTYRLLKELRDGEEKLDEVLAEPGGRARLLNRSGAFLRFAEEINPIHLALRSQEHSFCWIKDFDNFGVCTPSGWP